MKRYCYCSYTIQFITTIIVDLLNEFLANFHLSVAIIFKTCINKPWKGDTPVGSNAGCKTWGTSLIMVV